MKSTVKNTGSQLKSSSVYRSLHQEVKVAEQGFLIREWRRRRRELG